MLENKDIFIELYTNIKDGLPSKMFVKNMVVSAIIFHPLKQYGEMRKSKKSMKKEKN